MGARRASATAVVAVLGGVLLVTVLVVWAASIGPSDVLRGDGPDPPVRSYTVSPNSTPSDIYVPPDPLDSALQRQRGHNDVLTGIAIGIELLLLAGLLYGGYRAGRWAYGLWRQRDRPAPPAEQLEFDVLASPVPLARELAAGAAEQRDVLQSGTPRNAIVAMWNRFEVQAESAGARRRPWETSSEFTLRVLEAVDADSSAVARLAGLYREARFSDHELTEAHRDAALEALGTIHDGLHRVVRPTGRA